MYVGLKDYLFGADGEWSLSKCKNRECGLVWLNPAPIEEDVGIAYKNYYTHDMGAKTCSFSRSLMRKLYHLVRDGYIQKTYGYTQGVGKSWYKYFSPFALLHPHGRDAFDVLTMFLPAPEKNSKLLEVGCGSGYLLGRMKQLGWDVEGVDFDHEAVRLAREVGLVVKCGKLEECAYPSSFFDAIYMGNLIEHVHDPIELLNECYRLLKPAGKLVIVTPNTESMGCRVFGMDWRGLEPPRHIFLFNQRNLRCALQGVGFGLCKSATLIRGAQYILLTSLGIRRMRLAPSGSGWSKESIVDKFTAYVLQVVERVKFVFQPGVGEEVLVIAEKPGRKYDL